MQYLNLIYFIILTVYAYRFLYSQGRIVRSPFRKEDRLALTGPEMYWVLIFSTGLLAFSLDLGIDLMAIRLLTIMIMCLVGFKFCTGKPIWSLPIKVYVIYLVWLLIGCAYGPSYNYGLRVVLKYCYPLIICLFASAVVDNFATAFKAAVTARWVAVITLILWFIPYVEKIIPGVMWYATARAIHYISMMVLSLSLFFFTNEKKKNFWLTLLFLFPCFYHVFRTSILGSGIAIMAFSIIRWKAKSLPIIVGVLLAGIISVFTIPSLREKMFFDDNTTLEEFQEGKISMEDVNTNTRSTMWEDMQKRFYEEHKIIGSGTGSTQKYMAEDKVFGGLNAVHSDFVQMKCDNGLLGLILYCAMIGLIFIHCFLIYWNTNDNRLKLFAITAGASLLGVFATCYSDNTVNYSMATLGIPFGFYGMTLALQKRLK